MKFSTALLTLSLGQGFVNAFPSLDHRQLHSLTPEKLNAAIRSVEDYQKEKRFIIDVKKPIDVSGRHAFQAPKSTDQRGPCPGLNALANHGYISRTGITSFAEVVTAINQIMGMGLELSLILGIMGTVWTGNPLSSNPGFSIGGPPTGLVGQNLLGNLVGVLGKPRGLSGSHNWVESDSSLTRNDFYVTGDAATMNMTLFMDFHDRADKNGVLSMDLLADQAARRWIHSVQTNPYFYYGPVSGMVSRNAGYFFLGRILSNHTAEYPDGILTQEVLRSFFGVFKKDNGTFEYRKGHETIPHNWYRRPIEYGLVPLNLDIVNWVLKYPVLGSIGGNTGKVNSFTGVDVSDITNGVVNLTTFLENKNLLCFVFQVLKAFLPNSLSGLVSTLDVPIRLVTDTLAAPLLSLSCPAWKDLTEGGEPLWDALQQQFPGANQAGSSL